MTEDRTDLLVVGSGIAGLTFALRAAQRADVTIVTKKKRADSSTNHAQGGVAAVMDAADSVAAHVRDTLVAGAGLCHLRRVEAVVRDGPARVAELIAWGARFSGAPDHLSLGREGGHSHRRIVHARDRTGREIERALLDRVAEHPRIRVLEDHVAVELTVGVCRRTGRPRCAGAVVLDEAANRLLWTRARCTLVATGGLGRIYRHTTNPAIATGDGLALAARAGVALANLEFVQFHPTALYPAEERAALISEAVRGEGAVLRRRDGSDLMRGVHPLGSLAPRDVVARAIDRVLKESGDEYVLLDLSAIPERVVAERFPNIREECRRAGIDIPRDPIPVVPAAHYVCGGIRTDLEGRTSLAGLRAAGEVACTGLHGANRLASNSLLEALVMSHRGALALAEDLEAAPASVAPPLSTLGEAVDAAAAAALREIRTRVRHLMWDDAGIVRSSARLRHAASRLDALGGEAAGHLRRHGAYADVVRTANALAAAKLVVACARRRRESRGLHYTVDHPHRDNERFLRDTVVTGAGGRAEP